MDVELGDERDRLELRYPWRGYLRRRVIAKALRTWIIGTNIQRFLRTIGRHDQTFSMVSQSAEPQVLEWFRNRTG